jgi:cytochrome c oxidase subunit 2
MKKTRMLLMGLALCLPAVLDSASFAQEPSRTIEVHARRFVFDPADISVKQGETVRLKLISDDVPHSLLVKDLGINQTVTKSNPGEVVFTAKSPGVFQGRCGRFCGSGHGQMVFTIHVTDK